MRAAHVMDSRKRARESRAVKHEQAPRHAHTDDLPQLRNLRCRVGLPHLQTGQGRPAQDEARVIDYHDKRVYRRRWFQRLIRRVFA